MVDVFHPDGFKVAAIPPAIADVFQMGMGKNRKDESPMSTLLFDQDNKVF